MSELAVAGGRSPAARSRAVALVRHATRMPKTFLRISAYTSNWEVPRKCNRSRKAVEWRRKSGGDATPKRSASRATRDHSGRRRLVRGGGRRGRPGHREPAGPAAPRAGCCFSRLPTLGFVLAYVTSSVLPRLHATRIPLALLVGSHLWRFVGLGFVLGMVSGALPAGFGFPEGVGDILAAAGALALLPGIRRGTVTRGWLLAWNTFGFLDLVSAVTYGAAVLRECRRYPAHGDFEHEAHGDVPREPHPDVLRAAVSARPLVDLQTGLAASRSDVVGAER